MLLKIFAETVTQCCERHRGFTSETIQYLIIINKTILFLCKIKSSIIYSVIFNWNVWIVNRILAFKMCSDSLVINNCLKSSDHWNSPMGLVVTWIFCDSSQLLSNTISTNTRDDSPAQRISRHFSKGVLTRQNVVPCK